MNARVLDHWIGCFVMPTLLVAVVAAAIAAAAVAHEGPTNDDGCHFSETEGYHCH